MHIHNDYIYDPTRLIFYRSTLSQHEIDTIISTIPSNDNYTELKLKLDSYNAVNATYGLNALNEGGICITYNCNLRCNYCSESSIDGSQDTLETKDIIAFVIEIIRQRAIGKLVNKNSDPLRIFFSGGGEPTYSWKLLTDAIFAIKEVCLRNNVPLELGMATNGMLSKSQRSFIMEHFNVVMVSYDGMPMLQNKNRKTASSESSNEIVEETIRVLLNSKITLTVRTTIWHDDFSYLQSAAEYIFNKLGCIDEWSIRPIIPKGRSLERVAHEHKNLNMFDFVKYYIDLLEYADKNCPGLKITNPFLPNSLNTYSCRAISPTLSIPWLLANGDIVTCVESITHTAIIGCVKNGILKYHDTFSDPLLSMCQKMFVICKNCIAFRFCKGGCPLRHKEEEGHPTGMGDWECKMIINYWQYVFTKVLNGETCFGWSARPIHTDIAKKYDVLELIKDDKWEE